jgi:CTP:phosphocholine cytidylyltransferase-like protein
MIRYIVIEYKGSHSFSSMNNYREIIGYEVSDSIEYLRNKYNLPVIKNEFSFTIEGNGFSQYHVEKDIGRLLFDINIFESVYGDNIFKQNIFPILNSAIRDIKIEKLIEKV